jgi:uncharacterized membrane protein
MKILLISLLLILVDSLYLYFLGGPLFKKMIKNIQNEEMNIKFSAASFTYILLVYLLYNFIISQNKKPLEAFILGFCIYGVFDFTNLTIFNNYRLSIALIDMLWGGTLFYLVTLITYKLSNILNIQ